MAIYVSSDLHGTSVEDFTAFLTRSGFGERDWLYVLGDVIDRNGDGGVGMLRWLVAQPNAQLLLGNHEDMLLRCSWAFTEVTDENIDALSSEAMRNLTTWQCNGAEPTLKSLRTLLAEAPEEVEGILEYLSEAPLYETVDAGGRSFVLCHTAPANFSATRPLSDYTPHELLWNRPSYQDRYFEDATLIIGHTPTAYYGTPGRAYHADTWINIDTGAARSTGHPMLLRLDDMKEFYMD